MTTILVTIMVMLIYVTVILELDARNDDNEKW